MEEQQNTLHELEGTVTHVIFSNPGTGYIVFELNVNGTKVVAVGELGKIEEGETVLVRGTYQTHPRFGTQLRVSYAERRLPADTLNIERYLASGSISGVGPALARKIVDKFGEKTLDVITQEPTRLLEIRGISPKKCERIAADLKELFALRALTQFLQAYEISPRYSTAVYQKWAKGAQDLIAANPYLLCSSGIELPFQQADKIAARMNLDRNAQERICAGIIWILRTNAEERGHTCLPEKHLGEIVCDSLHIGQEDYVHARDALISDKLIYAYTFSERTYICLDEYHRAEQFIADRIDIILDFSRSQERIDFSPMIAELEQTQRITYAELQKKAIAMAMSSGVFILTGGPGTGKTTTLNGMIRLFERQSLRVMIAAPTGRAASRAAHLTDKEASTIHRLLGVEYDMAGNMHFLHDENEPLECDVMIVDEMSMVDVQLFEHLLRALRLGCKLILVGDSDQLPSVGAGTLLADLIRSKCVPIVALTEVFRQAQRSAIIMNAHRIINGQYPDLEQKSSDCFFFQRLTNQAVIQLLLELTAARLPRAYSLDPMQQIQIITPSRQGPIGCIELNRALQGVLNPPKHTKPEVQSILYTLREGDKVMQTKNNYDIVWHRTDGENGTGIFNGDIGRVTLINTHTKELTAEFEGKSAVYPFDMLDQLELAYAVTVHKSQGSEFEAVLMPVLGEFERLAYRKLLYTGVTRAKRLLILIGSKHAIYRMVDNNRPTNRYTCLWKMLLDRQQA